MGMWINSRRTKGIPPPQHYIQLIHSLIHRHRLIQQPELPIESYLWWWWIPRSSLGTNVGLQALLPFILLSGARSSHLLVSANSMHNKDNDEGTKNQLYIYINFSHVDGPLPFSPGLHTRDTWIWWTAHSHPSNSRSPFCPVPPSTDQNRPRSATNSRAVNRSDDDGFRGGVWNSWFVCRIFTVVINDYLQTLRSLQTIDYSQK